MPSVNGQLIGPADSVDVGFTWSFIGTATARDYPIILKAPFPFRITEVVSKCASGTSTATVRIDTVALGGTVNSVSSSEQTQAHTSANLVSLSTDVVVSFTAGAVDPQITIKGLRQ